MLELVYVPVKLVSTIFSQVELPVESSVSHVLETSAQLVAKVLPLNATLVLSELHLMPL
jgi:hypothetical protein